MHPPLTTEAFLLAAKCAEINALKQLQISCHLVTRVTSFIHDLQRERALSNVYLVSNGQRFATQRQDTLRTSDGSENLFREALLQLNTGDASPNAIRLFNSLAFVLHELEDLPLLRQQVSERRLTAPENTRFFNRIIAGLLTVVFEASDISTDQDINHALIAMFNFVQGKEYSGQERAWGLIGFAAGEFTSDVRDQIRTLQDAQNRCFEIFSDFTQPVPANQWRHTESGETAIELGRLRQMITRYRHGDSLPTAISEVWYDVASRRIDEMQHIELTLETDLLKQCAEKMTLAEEDLRLHNDHLKDLTDIQEPPMSPLSSLPDASTTTNTVTGINVMPGVNTKLAQSISELLQKQAERMQRINDELLQARQALDERKLIEKAKGVLMQTQHITEEQAYKHIRRAAMDNNLRIVEVANNIISVADMLTVTPSSPSDS